MVVMEEELLNIFINNFIVNECIFSCYYMLYG